MFTKYLAKRAVLSLCIVNMTEEQMPNNNKNPLHSEKRLCKKYCFFNCPAHLFVYSSDFQVHGERSLWEMFV